MLNYKTKDGKVTELEAQGSLAELLSDTTFLAHAIYGMLARSDKGLAKVFQAHFALLAADPESPMWGEQQSKLHQHRAARQAEGGQER